jgi:hypothetical protein
MNFANCLRKKPKYFLTLGILVSFLSLVAWRPPNDDQVVVIGNANTSNYNGFRAGNTGAINSTISGSTGPSCVVGGGQTGSTRNSLVGGSNNSLHTIGGLISGDDNQVGSAAAPVVVPVWSAAIGEKNSVVSTSGWAMGYFNVASGARSVGIGTGTMAQNANSTAVGRYNSDMASNDVLVIGSGSSVSTRFTALRVTNNGDVILGKAQGDIAMGEYSN